MVAVAEADVFDFGAGFEVALGAFDFEVFDEGDGVAVGEGVAVGVEHGAFGGCLGFGAGGIGGGPFVAAVGAGEGGAVFVGVFGVALGTVWNF